MLLEKTVILNLMILMSLHVMIYKPSSYGGGVGKKYKT
jgi:hypothetical protein